EALALRRGRGDEGGNDESSCEFHGTFRARSTRRAQANGAHDGGQKIFRRASTMARLLYRRPHAASQSGRIAPGTPPKAPAASSQTRIRAGAAGPGRVARPFGMRLKPNLP